MIEGMHYLCICVGCLWFQEKPYIDATPDAVVGCACCGDGLLEIKPGGGLSRIQVNYICSAGLPPIFKVCAAPMPHEY